MFVCLGKLLSLYSWVTGKCVFSSLYIKSNHSIRFTASLPESVRLFLVLCLWYFRYTIPLFFFTNFAFIQYYYIKKLNKCIHIIVAFYLTIYNIFSQFWDCFLQLVLFSRNLEKLRIRRNKLYLWGVKLEFKICELWLTFLQFQVYIPQFWVYISHNKVSFTISRLLRLWVYISQSRLFFL